MAFLAERRLRPQLQRTGSPGLQRKGDKLLEHLGTFFVRPPNWPAKAEMPVRGRHDSKTNLQVKPALLHGDLWSGNMTTTSDGSWAILDPAVYYGALLLVHEPELLRSHACVPATAEGMSFWKLHGSMLAARGKLMTAKLTSRQRQLVAPVASCRCARCYRVCCRPTAMLTQACNEEPGRAG